MWCVCFADLYHFYQYFMFFLVLFRSEQRPKFRKFQKAPFGTKSHSNCRTYQYVAVYRKSFYFFLLNIDHFLKFSCIFWEVKTKKKKIQTILEKIFEDFFSRFNIISFHHKCNRNRLVSAESECTICLTSCLTS